MTKYDKPTKRYIYPETYDALIPEHQDWYIREWKQYKEKRVRSYDECDSCGHRRFIGWVTERTPVGDPWRYRLGDGMNASINGLARYYDKQFLERARSMSITNLA